MPPESSCGKFCSQPSSPTSLSSSRGVGAPEGRPRKPADLGRQLDVLQRSAPGQQRGILEHEAERAVLPRLLRREAEHRDLSARRRDQVGDHAQQGRLAAAGWSEQAQEPAALDREGDVVQRRDGAPVGDEAHRHVAARDRARVDHDGFRRRNILRQHGASSRSRAVGRATAPARPLVSAYSLARLPAMVRADGGQRRAGSHCQETPEQASLPALRRSASRYPIFGRLSAVILRISSVMTSSSFGTRLENCPSSA